MTVGFEWGFYCLAWAAGWKGDESKNLSLTG